MKKNSKDISKDITDNVRTPTFQAMMDKYREKIHTQALEAEYQDYEKGVDNPDKDYEEEWKKAPNDQQFRDIYEAIRRYQLQNGAISGKPRKINYSDDEVRRR